MILLDLIAALIVSFILSAVFAVVTRSEEKRTGLFWIFLIIFLATWAGGIWLRPFGPIFWGIHWLTFLFVGIIIALILVIVTPHEPPRGRKETLEMLDRMEQKKELKELAYFTLSIFFWILLSVLILVIIIRYVLDLGM